MRSRGGWYPDSPEKPIASPTPRQTRVARSGEQGDGVMTRFRPTMRLVRELRNQAADADHRARQAEHGRSEAQRDARYLGENAAEAEERLYELRRRLDAMRSLVGLLEREGRLTEYERDGFACAFHGVKQR